MKATVACSLSPNASFRLVRRSLGSIKSNIGVEDYTIVTSFPDELEPRIKSWIFEAFEEDQIKTVPFYPYWADFADDAINIAEKNGSDYFISLHDDVWVESENFLPRVDAIVSETEEPVGWITFTDRGYLEGQPDTVPARPGFHLDYQGADNRRQMFQFHSLPKGWWKPELHRWLLYRVRNVLHRLLRKELLIRPTRCEEYYRNLPYDMPEGPVKCHAPWTHLMIIEMDHLIQIGGPEHWKTGNTLLLDEDWGLEALREGFFNMWIPEMGYIHGEGGRTRSSDTIYKHKERVHRLFKDKWGFPANVQKEDFEFVQANYGDTNIPWSIGRKSFEWDYFK